MNKLPNRTRRVLAYVTEGLHAFRRGNTISATVMLGIAAERVFLVLCETLHTALQNAGEKQKFGKLLDRFAIRPKLDWLHQKFQALQSQPGFPESANIMVTAIYDFMLPT